MSNLKEGRMKHSIKKRIQNTCVGFVSLLAMPISCFAGNGSSPESIIQGIIDWLTGDLARVVGILVVVISGYMHLEMQQIQKKTFRNIVIGMSLILGGPTLADLWWG